MSLRAAYNIEDLRRIAERRLPRIAYDFLERGAEEETTLAANRKAFERMRFVPRTLVDVSWRSQKVTIFGKTYDSPIGIAPTVRLDCIATTPTSRSRGRHTAQTCRLRCPPLHSFRWSA